MIRAILLLSLVVIAPVTSMRDQERKLRIINEAGFKVNIYWINRWKNDELVLNSDEGVFHGAETQINSYISHEFEVQEVAGKKTGKCGGPNEICRKGYFQVNENDDQLVRFKEGLEVVEHTDNVQRARKEAKDATEQCRATALESLKAGNPTNTMNNLMACLEESIGETQSKSENEVDFQVNLRKELGSKLSKYACSDPSFNMTTPSENSTWARSGGYSQVRVMLDRDVAKIHYIEDFATELECKTVQSAVSLKRFDGADGFYGSMGGIHIPWTIETNPITTLATKMYMYAQEAYRVRLTIVQTEEMYVLKYNENNDRYESHCDGECNGGDYRKRERMASFIVYCEDPEKGGATHFDNAGVHIIPKKYSATFYSYANPVKFVTDPGFTRTTECGVTEGSKTTIFHSVRFDS